MAGYIGRIPVPQAVLHAEAYIATAGQTTFSTSNGYVPGYIMVYKNGVLLPASDYTATDGSVVELDAGVACNAGDTVDIWIFGTFEAAFFTSLASDIDANSYNITNIGRIEFSDGTNLAPSITNTGDTDTGMYWPSDDTLAFATDGTERVRIDSSGRLGIGTTNPLLSLVVSNSGAEGIEFNPSSGGTSIIQSYNRSGSAFIPLRPTASQIEFYTGTSPTEKVRIDNSGNLIIGSTAFAGAAGKGIHVKDATRGNVIVETGSSKTEMFVDSGDFYLDHYQNGNIIFRTNTRTERLRINNNGVSFDGGANYLDDYEEGDWSPTVTGMTVTSPRARYFKVGNKVTICATISVSSSTGTSSNVRVTNLPFTPNILNGDAEWHGACMFTSVNFTNTYQTLCAYLYTGGTYVEFYGTRDNGTWDAVNRNELGAGDAFQFTITYNV